MRRLLVVVALIGLPAARASAQQEPPIERPPDSLASTLEGTVRDSLGIPIIGVSVILTPGSLIFSTDSAGRFRARGVPVGPVRVLARRLGLSPIDTTVIVPVSTVISLDLRMRRFPQLMDAVVIRAEQDRQCPRFSLEGIMCRRETGRGVFLNRLDILATEAVFPFLVLRDVPGFRQNLNGDPRTVESTVGWRCYTYIVDGRQPSPIDPVPRVKDMFAVEVYQPGEVPPEYRHWYWRGTYPCTLVVFWSNRVARQKVR